MEYYQFLMDEAELALENAYCPYSKFAVGSALLTEEQNIFRGCNIENASYSMSMCAERVAVSKAISEGQYKFEAIAIFHSGDDLPYPCGACLQVLAEFNPEITIIIANDECQEKYSLKELLTKVFSFED